MRYVFNFGKYVRELDVWHETKQALLLLFRDIDHSGWVVKNLEYSVENTSPHLPKIHDFLPQRTQRFHKELSCVSPSSFTVHRSSFIVHRSSFTVHRSFTMTKCDNIYPYSNLIPM
ncbi:MAG: hypothetical protein LBQ01_06405 [Prevotellaceae bacterium]|nr:hypothetical protein [Prevotellaceae bacterium]